MERLLEAVGFFGLLIIFIGTLPLLINVASGNTSTEALNQAMQIAIRFFVVGMIIVGFVTALVEN
jgi:hypothetical protein